MNRYTYRVVEEARLRGKNELGPTAASPALEPLHFFQSGGSNHSLQTQLPWGCSRIFPERYYPAPSLTLFLRSP